MTNEPGCSSTVSEVMRGIWKSSIGGVLTVVRWGLDPGGGRARAPRRRSGGWSLLRVELDDEVFLHRRRDLATLGLAQHLRRERVVVGLQPGRHLRGQLGGVADQLGGALGGAGLQRDDVAVADLVARDVDATAVDRPVAMADELAGLPARAGEAEADEDVVEAPLEQRQQVLARDAGLRRRLLVVVPELLLEHAVVAAGLLLLAQLHAVLALLLAAAAVVAGRVRAALDAALVGEAALPLEEELLPLTTALLALRGGISSHWSFEDPQTRRRLRGRQPLCACGVTSLTLVTSRPAACSERMAVSRPEPGPLTKTSTFCRPCSMPLRAAESAVTCAANGVDLREPLKPAPPADSHAMTLPSRSVRATIVLLNDVLMWAWPTGMFLRTRRRPR